MDHFTYRAGQLCAEDVPLADIAAAVGTPVFVYSTATLTRHYRVFEEALAGMDHGIAYAMKANSNIAVVRLLASLGAGADVVSGGELSRALAAGVAPDKIVFSGVGKTVEEIREALAARISHFNVESAPELEAISATAAAMGLTARIAFRVNPDVDARTHAKIATGKAENKFGIPIDQAPALYARAATMPGIAVMGVDVHIGSQLTELAPFEDAFTKVAELVGTLRAQGHAIEEIDLGGGLGIPYRAANTAPPLPFDYGALIRRTVGGLGAKVTIEPGRLIAGNAGVLLSRVIYRKEGAERDFLILDAAMNDLIRPTLYEAWHDIVAVAEPASDAPLAPVDVVGPVCETGDTFATQRLLPILDAGDLVAFRSAGAYGAVMSSEYNSRPLVPEVLVRDKDFAVIRRRPTLAEMISRDSMPSWLDAMPGSAAGSMLRPTPEVSAGLVAPRTKERS
ncbi:MAG: diaminopimelate decarboxylase [Pseudomonadota bacterium]